jgi:hypothetical protein
MPKLASACEQRQQAAAPRKASDVWVGGEGQSPSGRLAIAGKAFHNFPRSIFGEKRSVCVLTLTKHLGVWEGFDR